MCVPSGLPYDVDAMNWARWNAGQSMVALSKSRPNRQRSCGSAAASGDALDWRSVSTAVERGQAVVRAIMIASVYPVTAAQHPSFAVLSSHPGRGINPGGVGLGRKIQMHGDVGHPRSQTTSLVVQMSSKLIAHL